MSQRHKKKRTPKGTGKPDPSKDRSAHDAARGVKKVTLQDLTNELPSDRDFTEYLNYVVAETDRGAVVMSGSLVERALEDRIRANIQDLDDELAKQWFEAINAPFKSFAAKIALGRAMSLYDQITHDRLVVIKNIRNVFAHRMIPLELSHPALIEQLTALEPEKVKGTLKPRGIYALSCLAMAHALGMKKLGSMNIQKISTISESLAK